MQQCIYLILIGKCVWAPAEYKEMLFLLPFSFYSTCCLLRTSKISIFRKSFSEKNLQGRCLLFIYLHHTSYTGNLFLTRKFMCCNPYTKRVRQGSTKINFIFTIYKINPGKQSFKLLRVQLNDGSTRLFYISMSGGKEAEEDKGL